MKSIKIKVYRLWPAIFILFGTSWLFAPILNTELSAKYSLISHYEAVGQPYAWLFRVFDIAAGAVLLIAVNKLYKMNRIGKASLILLLIIGLGIMLDPILVISCTNSIGQCTEPHGLIFYLHALETVATACAVLALSAYSASKEKLMNSIAFLVFQILYAGLLVSNLASHFEFKTLSQYVYQILTVVWVAWYVGLRNNSLHPTSSTPKGKRLRLCMSLWAAINGVIALLLSLKHLRLAGPLNGLYFANDTAWLAQHTVIVGVILLYVSRHLYRGENRARQIFLVLSGIETLKYSIITPQPVLLSLYLTTFIVVFMSASVFRRGVLRASWQDRIDDALVLLLGVLASVIVALLILSRDHRHTQILIGSIDNYSDYVFSSSRFYGNVLQSALLAKTLSVMLATTVWFATWSLFRPIRSREDKSDTNRKEVSMMLYRFSNSSEDYFKFWPDDKSYYSAKGIEGFIAYRQSGSVAFALADPIASSISAKVKLLKAFAEYCHSSRLKPCVIVIEESSLDIYKRARFKQFKIGASAVISVRGFTDQIHKSKWGRWQTNRGLKAGYTYSVSEPQHSLKLLRACQQISNDWLEFGGHQEQSFALGYFDRDYLNNCRIHYIADRDGRVVAFANEVPVFKGTRTTIDLMRYAKGAQGSLPFLLINTIKRLESEDRFESFDLGFVPLAKLDTSIAKFVKTISAHRFSAAGLEQFKNKFEPYWVNIYVAYNGDLADLPTMVINLDKVLKR